MRALLLNDLKKYDKKFLKDPQKRTLRRVLYQNDLQSIFTKQENVGQVSFLFNHQIDTLPVANQKQSGRCWIFAGLNVLREKFAKAYGLTQFEFSQNYTAFYDKLEKINYFIESMDDFLEVDYDDRTLQHLLKTGIQDGGQWDMFVNLIKKYGVVPQSAMPETQSSSSTAFMNRIINIKLRQYAANARKAHQNKNEIETLKATLLEELYTFLVACFGMPPQNFEFEYQNKDGIHRIDKTTPQEFFKRYVNFNFDDYVSVIHAPTFDKPYYETYTVRYLGNVVGGSDVKYINLPMQELKALVIKQIQDQEVVWFGSDVARYGDRKKGIWDDETYDYEDVLNMSLHMSKEDQLLYSQSAMNHAMVITGVHINSTTKRFKIENSWGAENGNQGYYVASDSWFDQFVYQAVIHQKHLNEQQLAAWHKKPIVLKPWDPMGSLAK